MVIIIRHFLVDSENVNDNWLMLFDMADEDDEIIVFYTKKSPHMSYMSVIRLMENNKINIRFEESYEGTNALDFQLVSYMGYLMGCAGSFSENKCDAASAESCADEYIIMSNDTGYDPAVRFWKDKGFAVRRFNVNFCKQAVQRRKNIKYQVVADIPSKEDNVNNNTNINTDTDTDTDAITAKSYNLNELIDGNHSSYTDSEPLGDELATNDDLPSSDKLMTNDDLLFTDEQTPHNGSGNSSNKNEADEEAYALDSEFTEEKEYKTVQKYELVTILSYLIGVRNEILDHMCSDEYVELLNSLRENKNARILRYLCKARTGLLRNYKKTDNEIKYNLGNINRMEWFDAENINKLLRCTVLIIYAVKGAVKHSFPAILMNELYHFLRALFVKHFFLCQKSKRNTVCSML
jgi:hypothetical protein